MHYYLIIALQWFCIYHLIKHRNDYYWIFLIIFIPVFGSIIYIFSQVYNKRDVEVMSNDLVNLIQPTKKIKQLEKELSFAETFQNRVNLADAYFEIKDYLNAIKYYEVAIKEEHQNDAFVIKQLIQSCYRTSDFEKVIFYAEKIKSQLDFKASKSQFIYGLSLEKVGKTELAEKHLREIDNRYSNYEERLVLAKFLLEKENIKDSKIILEDIFEESKHMTSVNKRKHRTTINEVEGLLKSF